MNVRRASLAAPVEAAPAPRRRAAARAAAPGLAINWTIVAVLSGAALQVGTAVWFASAQDQRVGALEKGAATMAAALAAEQATLAAEQSTLAGLAQRVQDQGGDVDRLVANQDRVAAWAARDRRDYARQP